MSESKVSTVQVGPGATGLLGLLFVYLKVTNQIDWSWLWVLSPFWIPLALFVGFLLCLLTIVGVAMGWDSIQNRRR